jgi:5-methylcytosine-specific restriction endonuclease McrA
MSLAIPSALRDLVRQRAGSRCEYCQTSEWLTGLECEIDHIHPRVRGGLTTAENLCLACATCNGHKQAKISAIDPETKEEVGLFHPRLQHWHDHFAWNEAGVEIIGLTAIGRATIDALRLNHTLVVGARSIWIRAGYHPPD